MARVGGRWSGGCFAHKWSGVRCCSQLFEAGRHQAFHSSKRKLGWGCVGLQGPGWVGCGTLGPPEGLLQSRNPHPPICSEFAWLLPQPRQSLWGRQAPEGCEGCEGLAVGSVHSAMESGSPGDRKDGAHWRENRAFVRCHDTGVRAQMSPAHEQIQGYVLVSGATSTQPGR